MTEHTTSTPEYIPLTCDSQFLPSLPTLSITPTPPTDPPPAPPPLNLPPSRARRQLAARLALHSQQQREVEAQNETTEAVEHSQSFGPSSLNNNISDDDDDEEDAPLQFGEPLQALPKAGTEVTKSPPVRRQLDLDDFANSPAADADDTSSPEEGEMGHDVEMRVTLG